MHEESKHSQHNIRPKWDNNVYSLLRKIHYYIVTSSHNCSQSKQIYKVLIYRYIYNHRLFLCTSTIEPDV